MATANRTIAAPSKYPYGTELMINGIVYVVEDRGTSIKGNKIDMYVPTYAEAVSKGAYYIEVYIRRK